MATEQPSELGPQRELRILVGGCLEKIFGELISRVLKEHLGYAQVSVRIIETLPTFLETAAATPPDLFLLYLYFGAPADELVTDPATARATIAAQLAQSAADHPVWVTGCGLEIVTYLRAEFGKPVIVLTGCGDAPGRATNVEQAGGSGLLLLPFTVAQCVAAVGSCVERQPNPRE